MLNMMFMHKLVTDTNLKHLHKKILYSSICTCINISILLHIAKIISALQYWILVESCSIFYTLFCLFKRDHWPWERWRDHWPWERWHFPCVYSCPSHKPAAAMLQGSKHSTRWMIILGKTTSNAANSTIKNCNYFNIIIYIRIIITW